MSKLKQAFKAGFQALFVYLKSDKARKMEITLLAGAASVVVDAVKSALGL